MEKYLYLTENSWVNPWINGGNIPINPASTYRNEERNGIYTPDENIIHDSDSDLTQWTKFGIKFENAKKATFIGCVGHGQIIPDVINVSHYSEDGVILSFCNEFCHDIARRLNKKACVKIFDIDKLKQLIDSQLNCVGIMKPCDYTTDHRRNHFLKSIEDSWQKEFRIFWKIAGKKIVNLPKGIAEEIKLSD